jgi:pimeloyl-ACP methyl ester carboxylesterase
MDALHIEKPILGGFDWGARTADIIAALWPERCKALVSVSGYLIGSQKAKAQCRCRHRLSSNGGTNSILPRNEVEPGTTNTGTTLRSSYGSLLRRSGTSTIRRSIAAQRASTTRIM